MSINIMDLALRATLDPTPKLVLVNLANWSNEDGVCWPSAHRIAQRTSTSLRHTRRIMAELEQSGLISRIQRGRSGVVYQIHLAAVAELIGPAEKGGRPCPPFNMKKADAHVPLSSKRRTPMSEKADAHVRQNHQEPESKDSSTPLPSTSALDPFPIPELLPSSDLEALELPNQTRRPAAAKGKVLSEHAYLTRWWCYAFERITGSRYAFQKGKDGKILKTLLDGIKFDETLERACAYLLTPEARRWPKGAPTLGGLQTMCNQLAGQFDGEAEAKAIRAGLLPDDDVTLGYCGYWTPWETNEENVA